MSPNLQENPFSLNQNTLQCLLWCLLIASSEATATSCYGQNLTPTFDRSVENYTIPTDSQLKGGSYKPKNVEIEPGLADWSLLTYESDDEFVVSKVRFYGFGKHFNRRCLDWSTTDESILENVRKGLGAWNVRRACVSDLSTGRGQVGPGAHLGVLVIESERAPLVVGVSEVGFYLGTFHGTLHQHFESWILAKTLDNLIFELSGKHLKPEAFSRLSGEYLAKSGQAYFENLEVK